MCIRDSRYTDKFQTVESKLRTRFARSISDRRSFHLMEPPFHALHIVTARTKEYKVLPHIKCTLQTLFSGLPHHHQQLLLSQCLSRYWFLVVMFTVPQNSTSLHVMTLHSNRIPSPSSSRSISIVFLNVTINFCFVSSITKFNFFPTFVISRARLTV